MFHLAGTHIAAQTDLQIFILEFERLIPQIALKIAVRIQNIDSRRLRHDIAVAVIRRDSRIDKCEHMLTQPLLMIEHRGRRAHRQMLPVETVVLMMIRRAHHPIDLRRLEIEVPLGLFRRHIPIADEQIGPAVVVMTVDIHIHILVIAAFILDARRAARVLRVEAHAPFTLLAQARRRVYIQPDRTVTGRPQRHRRPIALAGLLRQQIDAAAGRFMRGRPVDRHRRTGNNFHAVHK